MGGRQPSGEPAACTELGSDPAGPTPLQPRLSLLCFQFRVIKPTLWVGVFFPSYRGAGRLGRPRMRRLDGVTSSTDVNLGRLQATVMGTEACRALVHGVQKAGTTERLSGDDGLRSKDACPSRPA